MTTIAVINPDSVPDTEQLLYHVRQAARAVLFNDIGQIALLFVASDGYHKLPGGGIEAGEDITAALTRECLEETGCAIYIGESLGEVHEYRKCFTQHQISYCFTAQVAGLVGVPQFTTEEIASGFTLEWYSLAHARMILGSQEPADPVGRFIALRDLAIITCVRGE